MTVQTWLKLIATAAVIYAGVQFTVVYVNYAQLSNILDSEAMEARRHKHSEKAIIENVISHMNRTATNLPMDFEIGVSGVGDRAEPIEIEMDYKEIVDLHLFKVPMKLTARGSAEPPVQ